MDSVRKFWHFAIEQNMKSCSLISFLKKSALTAAKDNRLVFVSINMIATLKDTKMNVDAQVNGKYSTIFREIIVKALPHFSKMLKFSDYL